ncbi:hypothetical protein ACJJTC_017823 [Scirpophaga incertulas]
MLRECTGVHPTLVRLAWGWPGVGRRCAVSIGARSGIGTLRSASAQSSQRLRAKRPSSGARSVAASEPVVRGEGPAAGCWPGPLRWLHSKPPRDARGERAAAETLEWHQYTYVTTSPNTTLDERRKWGDEEKTNSHPVSCQVASPIIVRYDFLSYIYVNIYYILIYILCFSCFLAAAGQGLWLRARAVSTSLVRF